MGVERRYSDGSAAAVQELGLEKHASKLRQLFRLLEETPGEFKAFLGHTPLNTMHVDPITNRVALTTSLPVRFSEMGLGKKLYGEVMRRMPEQTLVSDSMVSHAARRVWRGMAGRPGYSLRETMDYRPEAKTPLFTASLPPAAAHPSAARRGPLTPSRATPNSPDELMQLESRRAADVLPAHSRVKVRTFERRPGLVAPTHTYGDQLPAPPDTIVFPMPMP